VVYNTATYTLARVDGARMALQAFNLEGEELDYIELSARGARAAP